MYCVDTNILIDFMRVGKFEQELKENEDLIHITPIVLCELYKGTAGSTKPQHDIMLITKLIQPFRFAHFNEDACRIFGEEYLRLKTKGKVPSEADLMIASIAKAHNLIVVTNNKKDFEQLGCRVESW